MLEFSLTLWRCAIEFFCVQPLAMGTFYYLLMWTVCVCAFVNFIAAFGCIWKHFIEFSGVAYTYESSAIVRQLLMCAFRCYHSTQPISIDTIITLLLLAKPITSVLCTKWIMNEHALSVKECASILKRNRPILFMHHTHTHIDSVHRLL